MRSYELDHKPPQDRNSFPNVYATSNEGGFNLTRANEVNSRSISPLRHDTKNIYADERPTSPVMSNTSQLSKIQTTLRAAKLPAAITKELPPGRSPLRSKSRQSAKDTFDTGQTHTSFGEVNRVSALQSSSLFLIVFNSLMQF